MRNFFRFVFFTFIFLINFLYITPSTAAEIGKSNKKQAIVNLNGDTVEVGKKYFVIDPSTLKKRAQIRIDKITGDKARASILKGKVAPGFSLVLKNSGSSDSEEAEDSENSEETTTAEGSSPSRSLLGIKNSWGLLGSYIMNTMSAKRTLSGTTGVTNMTGSTFGLGAFYNFPFSSNMSLKFSAAYEQMGVAGTIAIPPGCASTSGTSCEATISYFSGYGHINYYFSTGKMRPLVGLGLGFLFPMSKSSTALNTDKISMNQVVNLALGVDILTGKNNYIPLIFEYNYFSPSDTVTASMMMIKAGWAWDL